MPLPPPSRGEAVPLARRPEAVDAGALARAAGHPLVPGGPGGDEPGAGRPL